MIVLTYHYGICSQGVVLLIRDIRSEIEITLIQPCWSLGEQSLNKRVQTLTVTGYGVCMPGSLLLIIISSNIIVILVLVISVGHLTQDTMLDRQINRSSIQGRIYIRTIQNKLKHYKKNMVNKTYITISSLRNYISSPVSRQQQSSPVFNIYFARFLNFRNI
jgi:hypothetical protein